MSGEKVTFGQLKEYAQVSSNDQTPCAPPPLFPLFEPTPHLKAKPTASHKHTPPPSNPSLFLSRLHRINELLSTITTRIEIGEFDAARVWFQCYEKEYGIAALIVVFVVITYLVWDTRRVPLYAPRSKSQNSTIK